MEELGKLKDTIKTSGDLRAMKERQSAEIQQSLANVDQKIEDLHNQIAAHHSDPKKSPDVLKRLEQELKEYYDEKKKSERKLKSLEEEIARAKQLANN